MVSSRELICKAMGHEYELLAPTYGISGDGWGSFDLLRCIRCEDMKTENIYGERAELIKNKYMEMLDYGTSD